MSRSIGVLATLATTMLLAGCPDDPDRASTWTKKLDDPKESERAAAKLEGLGDPSAIEALGKLWEDKRDGRVLQIMIGLARPLTPQQAKDTFMADYEDAGRPASWDKALPYLTKALSDVQEDSPRSVESAMKAADALGEAKLPEGLKTIVAMVEKTPQKKLIGVHIASIRALGKFDNDKATAAAALIKILQRDVPQNPRTIKEKDQMRAAAEKFDIYLGTTGAAINALSELRTPLATKPLVLALYKTPELFGQLRRALVASGPEAEKELLSILTNSNEEVKQLFASKKLDQYCGDRNEHGCVPVSAKDFYPAVVIGDFYNPKDVGALLAALDRPAVPVYYLADEPSGNTQYNAIFDALRKIGAAEGKDKLHAMWVGKPGGAPKKAPPKGAKPDDAPAAGPNDDIETRVLAIGAYAFVARDNASAKELATIADSPPPPGVLPSQGNRLRQAAAEAFARLSNNPDDIAVLLRMAKTQFDASVKAKATSEKEKPNADKADAELEKYKTAFVEANQKAAAAGSSNDKDLKKATQAAKKQADSDLKDAKKKNRDATLPYKEALKAATDFRSYGRTFISHIARIAVAIRCKDKLDCYAATLTMKVDDAVNDVAPYLKNFSDDKIAGCEKDPPQQPCWSKEEKLWLVEAEVERSMLELGKRGEGAASYTDLLLDNAKTDDRIMRQSIMLALPKIAKVPCKKCEQKLDVVIRIGAGKAAMQELNLETQMLRNYFAWAGGNTPSSPLPVDDTPATPTPTKAGDKADDKPDKPADKPADKTPAKPADKTPAKKPATPAPKKKGGK